MPGLLYIAGPYRDETINGIFNNIIEARKRMEWAWSNDWVPICPHMNSAFSDGVVPDEIILAGYLKVVHVCDAILMMSGWKESKGSVDEYLLALKLNLFVINDPLGVR